MAQSYVSGFLEILCPDGYRKLLQHSTHEMIKSGLRRRQEFSLIFIMTDKETIFSKIADYHCAISALHGKANRYTHLPVLYIAKAVGWTVKLTGRKQTKIWQQYRSIWVVIFKHTAQLACSQWFCLGICSSFLRAVSKRWGSTCMQPILQRADPFIIHCGWTGRWSKESPKRHFGNNPVRLVIGIILL